MVPLCCKVRLTQKNASEEASLFAVLGLTQKSVGTKLSLLFVKLAALSTMSVHLDLLPCMA